MCAPLKTPRERRGAIRESAIAGAPFSLSCASNVYMIAPTDDGDAECIRSPSTTIPPSFATVPRSRLRRTARTASRRAPATRTSAVSRPATDTAGAPRDDTRIHSRCPRRFFYNLFSLPSVERRNQRASADGCARADPACLQRTATTTRGHVSGVARIGKKMPL